MNSSAKDVEISFLSPSERFVYKASLSFLNELGMAEAEPCFDDTEEVDWDVVFDILRSNRLFPTLYSTVEKQVPVPHRQRYADFNETSVRSVDEIITEVFRLLPLIEKKGIGVSISKGFVMGKLIYGSAYQRFFNDVDLLTNESEMETLGNLLMSEGYEPERNKGTAEVPYHESYWETEFGKQLSKKTTIHIEVKRRNSSFTDAHTKFFRDSLEQVKYDGTQILTENLLANCILVIGSAYKNSDCAGKYVMLDFVKLREYVDLAAFLLRHGSTLDSRKVIEILESINYGYQAKVVMRDMCSLYPAFSKHRLVAEIVDHEWAAPEYSFYYPNITWRSPIIYRVFKREEGRAEFVELLKAKWFDASRECVVLSKESPLLKGRLAVVGIAAAEVEFQFGFGGEDRMLLEVEIPNQILGRYRCRFLFRMAFEDSPLVIPPHEMIEIEAEKHPVQSAEAGAAKRFRVEADSSTLLNGRSGVIRLCVAPILARYLENGTTKDITEDHYWKMPILLELRRQS